MTTKKAQTDKTNSEAAKRPDWVVKAPRNSRLERIGAGWNRDKDGGICIRLVGRQVIDGDLYLYPAEDTRGAK